MKKQCTKCGRILDSSRFYKGKRYKDGLRSQCKECMIKYNKERCDSLKWESMVALGGRCNHMDENGVRCSKNVFTDLKELHLAHPHDNGEDHRKLISNRQGGVHFYKPLKERNWNTDGFVVEIMCKAHHYSFDIGGKKHHGYGKHGKSHYNYKEGKFNDSSWLKKEYETKSIKKIAKENGVCHITILNRMNRFNMPRRKPGQRP